MPERWSIFVDESGGFHPADTSWVVGILTERSAASLDRGVLRDQLAEIWGPGPWPPHGRLLWNPASAVLHAAFGRDWKESMPAGRFARKLRPHIREAIAELEGDDGFRERLEAIRDGAYPSKDDYAAAEALIAHHPSGQRIYGVRIEQAQAMDDLVARVFRSLGPECVTLVPVLADRDPKGASPGHLQLRPDSYTRALGVLHERICRLVGGVVIDTSVLTRYVEVEGLGDEVPLQAYQLKPLQDSAVASTNGRCSFRNVGTSLSFQHVPDQGRPLHPMLVLADWVASRLRNALQDSRPDLAGLVRVLANHRVATEAMLYRQPALAPDLSPLPSVAAAGVPADRIRAAFAGTSPPSRNSSAPPWAWEQADLWERAAKVWP